MPSHEDDNFGFKEQIIPLEINLTIKIDEIKELLSLHLNSKIFNYTEDFPPKRMILKSFYQPELINSNTAAFYNLNDESFIELILK